MQKRIKEQEDGSLLIMSAQSDAAWALSNGFSEELYDVVLAENGRYYLAGQQPSINLDQLKTAKRLQIDAARDSQLHDECVLEVEELGGVTYNGDAITNILGLMQLGVDDEATISYILANDSTVSLNCSQLAAISAAFIAHRQEAYARKSTAYAAIAAASTAEELAAISFSPESNAGDRNDDD